MHLQSFQRGPSGRVLQVEAHLYPDSSQLIVFWDDILEAFPGAISVLNGTVVVSGAPWSHGASSIRKGVYWKSYLEKLYSSRRCKHAYTTYDGTMAQSTSGGALLNNQLAPSIVSLDTDRTPHSRFLVVPTEREASSVRTDGSEDDEEQENHGWDIKEGATKSWFSSERGSSIYYKTELRAIQIALRAAAAGSTEGTAITNGVTTLDGTVSPNSIVSPNGTATPNGYATPDGAATPTGVTTPGRPTTPNSTASPGGTNAPDGAISSLQIQGSDDQGLEEVTGSLNYPYKARAMFSHKGNPFDANELSHVVDEVLDIANIRDMWWQARKQDGTIGIVFSIYFQQI
ncbi:Transmembrane osmosensor [Linnemannia zychae]|nr:Transmembrane osmosensor [Linnemannia zychae]